MKAVYIAEYGDIDKLVYGDRPDPAAGPGEVVVRVRASALNHLDLGVRSGRGRGAGSLPPHPGLRHGRRGAGAGRRCDRP